MQACFKTYLDFYQFLLSFRDKIVGVKLFHHNSLENFYETQLGDVGPVRVLGSRIKIQPKFT